MAEIENNFKVRLIPISSLLNGTDTSSMRSSQVSFDVTPQFSESRSAEYTPVTPVHMPGSIQVYKHTNSRNFEITATLISRNVQDARKNMADLQKLRAWMLPYFGATDTISKQNSLNRLYGVGSKKEDYADVDPADAAAMQAARIQYQGVQLRGAPPDVLFLYAYSTGTNDDRFSGQGTTRVNINRVPVVMTNLTIAYPDDVDYLPVYDPSAGDPTNRSEPFPKKLTVTCSLAETHSPREYEQFDLNSFKLGKLVGF